MTNAIPLHKLSFSLNAVLGQIPNLLNIKMVVYVCDIRESIHVPSTYRNNIKNACTLIYMESVQLQHMN